jgi:hypothetical protein
MFRYFFDRFLEASTEWTHIFYSSFIFKQPFYAKSLFILTLYSFLTSIKVNEGLFGFKKRFTIQANFLARYRCQVHLIKLVRSLFCLLLCYRYAILYSSAYTTDETEFSSLPPPPPNRLFDIYVHTFYIAGGGVKGCIINLFPSFSYALSILYPHTYYFFSWTSSKMPTFPLYSISFQKSKKYD